MLPIPTPSAKICVLAGMLREAEVQLSPRRDAFDWVFLIPLEIEPFVSNTCFMLGIACVIMVWPLLNLKHTNGKDSPSYPSNKLSIIKRKSKNNENGLPWLYMSVFPELTFPFSSYIFLFSNFCHHFTLGRSKLWGPRIKIFWSPKELPPSDVVACPVPSGFLHFTYLIPFLSCRGQWVDYPKSCHVVFSSIPVQPLRGTWDLPYPLVLSFFMCSVKRLH